MRGAPREHLRLPHLLDLVRLLEHLAHALPREGRWRGVVLLTVEMMAPFLVGHDGLRIYLGPAIEASSLKAMDARELLTNLGPVTPLVDRAAPLLRFDVDGAGPVADRVHRLNRADQERVHATIDEALVLLARWRQRLDD